MAANATSAPVHKRLANALDIELGIAEALASAARALDQAGAMAEVERLRTVVREHVAALAAVGLDPGGPSPDALAATESGGRPTQAISSAQQGFAATTQAYADLYTTARASASPSCVTLPCDISPTTSRGSGSWRGCSRGHSLLASSRNGANRHHRFADQLGRTPFKEHDVGGVPEG